MRAEIFGVGIAARDIGGMVPVEIVMLDKDMAPMDFGVEREEVVEDLDIAMVGEAKVADATAIALLDKVIEETIVDKATVEKLHRRKRGALLVGTGKADAMEHKIVEVVDMKFGQRIFEHSDAGLETPRGRVEIGEFGRDKKLVALMVAESDADSMFGQALTIDRSSVEEIDTVCDGIVDHLIDTFLVEFGVILIASASAHDGREAHAAEAQERDLVVEEVGAVGHFVGRDIANRETLGRGSIGRRAASSDSRSGKGAAGKRFEKIASIHKRGKLTFIGLFPDGTAMAMAAP